MKKSSAWLASSLLFLAAPALATSDKDCERPKPPPIPDGRTASQVEMISAKQRTKLYVESAEGFLSCLEEARASVTETGRDVKLKRIDRKRDEVTQERDATVAKYNEQVRVYKVRTGEVAEEEPAAGSAPPPAEKPAPDPRTR